MPATVLTLYAGSAYDFTFGGTGSGWSDNPLPAEINDGADNPVDPTYGLFQPGFSVARDFYAEYSLALPPLGIVSIASLRLIAWVMATGTGGTYDTPVSAMVRPAGSGVGAGGDYYSTPITLTSESAAAELYHSLEFAAWTVNPLTSLPWTVSDLAAMKFGLRFQCPAVDPVNNASGKLGRLRMVLEATSTPADTAAVRTVGSTALRVFSRELLLGKIAGPAVAADVGIGEIFFLEHNRGRRPGGPGWGRKPWQHPPLIAVSKSVEWLTGQATINWEGPRRRMARIWIPGLTTLGHSLDGKGQPLLHSGGGGPACARAGVKWINRPGNPTDNVMQAATENILGVDYRGMCIESGDDTNLVINSTFSQGTGNTLDNWTPSVSGTGTVTQETARVGIDETGLRRAAHVDVGVTDISVAIIEQAVAVTGAFRLMIRTYNDYGAGKLGCVLQRASDSAYYNFASDIWDVSFSSDMIARIGNDAGGYKEWLPGEINPGGADTITVKIGYFGEAGSVLAGIGYRAYIWSVDLVEGEDHVGTPIVTTTTALAKIGEIVSIPNNEAIRWWGHERGFSWSFGVIPLWNAEDLADGEIRMCLWVEYGNGNNAQIGYQKGVESIEDRWFFSIVSSATGYTSQFVVAALPDMQPQRGRLVKLQGYWIGPEAERDLTIGQILIGVNDDWTTGEPATVPAGEPTMDAVSTAYLGHAWDSETPLAWWQGFIRQVLVHPCVLYREEFERLPS